jgi:hypothetical protein
MANTLWLGAWQLRSRELRPVYVLHDEDSIMSGMGKNLQTTVRRDSEHPIEDVVVAFVTGARRNHENIHRRVVQPIRQIVFRL